MFAIAYGIALDQFVCNEYLVVASNWCMKNVFDEVGLKTFENVALRYYGAGIIKIAVSKGLLGNESNELVTPPYNYEPMCLPLCKDALNTERMGGYQAIDYDLARYVLCDKLDDYFKVDYKTKEYNSFVNTFIQKYKATFDISEWNVDGFIIALAYEFLLNQGWNLEKFWTYENKEKWE